jgi:hypothetical protein
MRERIEDVDPAGDVHFIKEIDPAKCVEIVKKLCNDQLTRWYLSDPMADVQVLVPMHKGTAGISTFNVELQSVLNDASAAQGPVDTWRQFRVGDRILQLKNNYDKNIFNGDLGRILFIDKEKSRMVMDFNGEEVALEGVELEDIGLAYAMSIHKSQGSEFPIVIIPLLKQHFLLLQRNLLYTALTRGRHKVFFVGDPVAYQMAVRNAESVSRVTGLKEQLLRFAKMFGKSKAIAFLRQVVLSFTAFLTIYLLLFAFIFIGIVAGIVRYFTHWNADFSLVFSTIICLTFFLWSIYLSRQRRLSNSTKSLARFFCGTALVTYSIYCLSNVFFDSFVSLGSPDAGNHVQLSRIFLYNDPTTYNGFVGLYSFVYLLQKFGFDTFDSFKISFYTVVALVASTPFFLLALKSNNKSESANIPWTESALVLLLSLPVLYRILLPSLHYMFGL